MILTKMLSLSRLGFNTIRMLTVLCMATLFAVAPVKAAEYVDLATYDRWTELGDYLPGPAVDFYYPASITTNIEAINFKCQYDMRFEVLMVKDPGSNITYEIERQAKSIGEICWPELANADAVNMLFPLNPATVPLLSVDGALLDFGQLEVLEPDGVLAGAFIVAECSGLMTLTTMAYYDASMNAVIEMPTQLEIVERPCKPYRI